MEEVLPESDDAESSGWSRRTFLETTALGSLAASVGGTRAAHEEPHSPDMQSPPNQGQSQSATALRIGPELNLGGRRIVADGEYGYDTIQGAYDDASSGDVVFVHGSYDAQEADEAFPIVIDQSQKEVVLTGGHPSGSVIDAGDTDLDIHRPSHNAYDDTPIISDGSEFTRLRSDGVAQETDLRDTEGRYRGDIGIHDGDGEALWGPAVWNGRDWISIMEPMAL